MSRLAESYLFQGEYEQAVEWARKAVREPNTQFWIPVALASALGYVGSEQDIRFAREQLLKRKPEISIGFVRQASPIIDMEDLEVYIEGLRKAGTSRPNGMLISLMVTPLSLSMLFSPHLKG